MELEGQECEAGVKIHCKWNREIFYGDLVGFETKKLISKVLFGNTV